MKRTHGVLQILAAAATLLSTGNILAAQQVAIPEGTVIELRMETGLNSATSHLGDSFVARVLRTVSINGVAAIPENSEVDGRVSLVQPAERSSHSGVIGVEFYQLSMNNKLYAIEGTLTSLRADERIQIINEESRIQGKSSTTRNIMFIGGGTGAGAVIGALANGGKGAGIGALTGGGVGVLGSLLSRGSEAEVASGSEVAMQLVKPVMVNAGQAPRQSRTGARDRTLYTATAMVRGAQTALRQRGYYTGISSGQLDEATRRAIAHYQIDNHEAPTGDLDEGTAASLGLVRTVLDKHSVTSAASRQNATDIDRKALALLNGYQTRLGVRIDEIRTKPQISESALDLLLQVEAFAKVAVWYDQTSQSGQIGEAAFDNVARILLRSAGRVEQGLEASPQDRAFGDAWTSIETNLRQIDLTESRASR